MCVLEATVIPPWALRLEVDGVEGDAVPGIHFVLAGALTVASFSTSAMLGISGLLATYWGICGRPLSPSVPVLWSSIIRFTRPYDSITWLQSRGIGFALFTSNGKCVLTFVASWRVGTALSFSQFPLHLETGYTELSKSHGGVLSVVVILMVPMPSILLYYTMYEFCHRTSPRGDFCLACGRVLALHAGACEFLFRLQRKKMRYDCGEPSMGHGGYRVNTAI